MRLWLKDSERRPDPEPVKTDDRKVVLVGLVLWLVALAGLLLFLAPLLARARLVALDRPRRSRPRPRPASSTPTAAG